MNPYNTEEFAQTLFEEAGDALFLFDPDTEQIVDVNPLAQRMSRYSRADLLRMKITYLFRTEIKGGLQRLKLAFQKTGIFHSQEGFYLRHQEDQVWVPVNLTITRLHLRPKPLGLITARDITDRKQWEDELRKSENRFRSLVERGTDGISLLNSTATITYASPSLTSILGYTVEEFVGRTAFEFIHPDDLKRTQALFAEVVQEPGQMRLAEFQCRHKDGRWRYLEATGTNRLQDPSVQAIVVNFRDITERKCAEQALRLAEEKYRGIFENAAEGIYQTSLDGQFLTANPMLAQTYGFSSPQGLLANLDHKENHYYADPGRRAEFARQMKERGSVTNFESRIRRQDGTCRWISENARTVFALDGALIGYEGTVVDVTERKEAEEAVAWERYLLNSLMDNVLELIYFKDRDSRFIRVNPAITARFKLSDPSQAIGKSDQDFFASAHSVPALEDEREVMRTGKPLVDKEEKEVWSDGRVTWVSTTKMPLRARNGDIIGTFGVSREITERKRSEEALRASEARYRSLIENMVQGVFLKDPELRFVAANKPFCQSLGRTVEEVLGKTDFDFYPAAEAEKYRQLDLQVLQQGKGLEMEEEQVRQGNRRILRIFETPVKDDRGQTVGVQGIIWDVTERRILEDQLRQSQKMQAVGQLAGGVAHDFNNLLTAILGNISLVQEHLVDPAAASLLAVAEKAGLRAAELTRQLLGFSRRSILQPEPVNLNQATEDTVRILRRTIDPRITVLIRPASDLWMVLVDPSQLGQVLMNLCINARDAMPEGGRLVLETENVVLSGEDPRLNLGAGPREYVRLRVQDSGIGMAPEVRARIFEPFFTTKEPGKGTGLGLAMVFGILQQHQGWVECVSEVNRGSRFDVYLPRHHHKAALATAAPKAQVPLGGHETILVADDEPMIRDLARTILTGQGYEVILAEDGLQAVNLFDREKHRIDLVILDLTMPRLSGRDAFLQMIAIDPRVRALFSSGFSAEPGLLIDHPQLLGFVNKPYRAEELARKVRKSLDELKAINGTAKA